MKKGKLRKILASGAMGIMALAMPFALTGCDKDSDINVRVEGDYVQWQVEGEDSWTNLISVNEIKDLLGESYKGDTGAKGDKGDTGNPGINGKEVEFRNNGEYIQWRYVDANQADEENWENLLLLTSLKGEPGQSGSNGTNGKTPYIGENGNWWIGDEDTEVKAESQDGQTPTIEISDDGYWVISGEKSDHKAIGTNGVGIKSITIDATNSDEIKTTYIIEFDKGEPFSFVVKNGLDGKDMVSEKISITFNYMLEEKFSDYENDILDCFVNLYGEQFKESKSYEINKGDWVTLYNFSNMPFADCFLGWYAGEGIDETKITSYTSICDNVTLKAKFDTDKINNIILEQQAKELYLDSLNNILSAEKVKLESNTNAYFLEIATNDLYYQVGKTSLSAPEDYTWSIKENDVWYDYVKEGYLNNGEPKYDYIKEKSFWVKTTPQDNLIVYNELYILEFVFVRGYNSDGEIVLNYVYDNNEIEIRLEDGKLISITTSENYSYVYTYNDDIVDIVPERPTDVHWTER